MKPDENCLKNSASHVYQARIRERHLDAFGHVSNTQYLILFEEARWEMVTVRGFGLEMVRSTGIGTVVLECSVRFKNGLKLRDEICISTGVKEMNKKLIWLIQDIRKPDGTVVAEAEFLVGCFDLRERKLISPPKMWIRSVTGGEAIL